MMLSVYNPEKGYHVLKHLSPANAFEWRRYTAEEHARLGVVGSIMSTGVSYNRNAVASQTRDRLQAANPHQDSVNVFARARKS